MKIYIGCNFMGEVEGIIGADDFETAHSVFNAAEKGEFIIELTPDDCTNLIEVIHDAKLFETDGISSGKRGGLRELRARDLPLYEPEI